MCFDDEVYLRVDCTMTLDNENTVTHQVVVALNEYGYDNYSTLNERVYTLLPRNNQDLNEMLCEPNNRKGFLCEDCIHDYGPTLYSINCADCRNGSTARRVALFLALKLFPITIIFFLVLMLQLNVTQGYLFGYILFCQGHVLTARAAIAFYQLLLNENHSLRWVFDGSLFISSFWVMDYSPFLGPLCISPSLNSLNIHFLNYISVVYPLFLVLLSYLLIELHARNFRPVVYCWKPFNIYFARIRRTLSASDSIIHAYATLFLLLFSTLNSNSHQLLKVINVYSTNGTLHRGVLYHRPSIKAYTNDYMIHFSSVLSITLILGIIPTAFLCVFPVKYLRNKINSCLSLRLQIALNTFANTFQGTFRDKYRALPAVFATLTILLTFFGIIGQSVTIYTIPIFVYIIAIAAVITAYVRPCKSSAANISLTFHLLWMAGIGNLFSGYAVDIGAINTALLFAIMLPVPHILVFLWVLYKIIQQISCFHDMCKKLKKCTHHDSNEDLLPDRLENSVNYCALVVNASSNTR